MPQTGALRARNRLPARSRERRACPFGVVEGVWWACSVISALGAGNLPSSMRAKLCWLWLAVLLSGCGENGAGSDGPGAASTSDSASTDGSPTAMAATNTGTTATTMGAVSTSSDVGGAVTTTGTGTTGQGGAASVGSIGTSSTTGVAAATVSTSDSSTSASSMSSGGTSTTGGNVSSEGSTGVGGGTGSTTAGAGGTGSVALHPDDAVEFDGHWYRFTQASVGGAEAEATCEGLGGTLACVESEAEDDFLFTLAGTARPWIGLNNEADVNTWVWVNGSPVTYTNWQPGQPDYPDNERWVKIAEDSRWDDGNIASSYICEWES